MYAVIQTSGKQYKVTPGGRLKIEQLPIAVGETVQFENVLLVVDENKREVGTPYLKNYVVKGTVVSEGRHETIRIIKFRRRKHHKKQMGHRQWYTEVKIEGIEEH